MPEQLDRSVYRRRRLTLAAVLIALIALAGVLIAQLTDDGDSASPDATASSADVASSGSASSTAPATSEPITTTDPGITSVASVATEPTEASSPPTSAAPPSSTAPPATDPPATEPPATAPTATDPPATEPPATEPAATEPPATSAPVEPPTTVVDTSAPPASAPATDAPTTVPPTTGPPTTIPPTVPVTTPVTEAETTVPPTLPDTPPNEVTVRWDDDVAVVTGVVGSADTAAVARDVAEEMVLGAPIDDRTVVDDSIEEPSLTVLVEDLRGIGFDRDVYDEVPDELAETLDQLVAVLEQRPAADVVLIGHAITDGDDAADRAKALERAETARAYVIEAGIDGERVSAFGAGEDGAVPATGSTSINRRIDYMIGDLPIS